MIVALSGGVGGAKLAWGLNQILPPDRLGIVVNTGDDFEHVGLHISPDLDTVMYTLAGIADRERGWGLGDETWEFMGALARLGGPAWFQLGDRDLATHVYRTARLRQGDSLADITADACKRLGIECAVVPMSDDPVRTIVHTAGGPLDFQDYFVRRRCEPAISNVSYKGIETARTSPRILSWLSDPRLEMIVLCPSNPLLSLGPILGLADLNRAIGAARVPRVAVSPIIAGGAVKGPAAKMLRELGREVSSLGVARHYLGLVDCMLVDEADAHLVGAIEALGVRVIVAATLMRDDPDRARLARQVVEAGRSS
jgi:LPPG:FO 2-phospho-L-lactate transferase